MAHQQQIDFCNSVKRLLPDFFCRKLVLDIGSLDINGNNQYLFDDCLYLGVDLLPGKNVDLASKGHELNFPSESLDVIISTECFEHDMYYVLTLQNIVRMLKPGGLFLFSCATTGRPEHGTLRTTPSDAPLTQHFNDWGNYYKNLEESDIRAAVDVEGVFREFAFSVNHETHDLYFWGIKKGEGDARNDYSFLLRSNLQQEQITGLNRLVAQRDVEIGELCQAMAQRDRQLVVLNEAVTERDGQLLVLNEAVADRDRRLAVLNRAVAERQAQTEALSQRVSERDRQIDDLCQRVTNHEREIAGLKQTIADREGELARVLKSRSWRITRPLRQVVRLISSINGNARP